MLWIVFFLCLLIIGVLWYGSRPNYYKNVESSDFKRFIEGLVNQGENGSLLFIKHNGSKRFVQFAKYLDKDSGAIINFGFPDTKWSKGYFKLLSETFDKKSIDFTIQGTKDESGYVSRFLEINRPVANVGQTIDELFIIAKITFDIMGVDKNDRYRVHFGGKLKI